MRSIQYRWAHSHATRAVKIRKKKPSRKKKSGEAAALTEAEQLERLAQQAKEQRNWEVIDEREGDQFVNSASRSKQRRTQRWSAEETERFFQAISQWGTDFEMITRLFPHRTRREIKSKWTKESRQNPKRLDDAFSRRVAVDLTAYGHAAGVDLSGPPPEIVPKAQEVRALEKEEGGA